MKNIHVAFISNQKLTNGITGVSSFLNQIEKQNIDTLLWSTDGYKPSVSFAMAYTDDSILLKYFVTEKYFKADYHHINDPVYKDSCVEFFIAFGDDEHYYNLEFNPVGVALIAYGSDKNDRKVIDPAVVAQIKIQHNMSPSLNGQDDTYWELTLSIPFCLFIHHSITSLSGMRCRANFYKCGDDLPVPHFLSWNTINHPQPNFHLLQFFGEISFA